MGELDTPPNAPDGTVGYGPNRSVVLTYDSNSVEFSGHFSDSLIHYPRFVRLTRCPPEQPQG